MKNHVKELTEGMQRLCAVANRIVQGKSSRIELDLLMDNLRGLYDVALQMQENPAVSESDAELQPDNDHSAIAPSAPAHDEEKMMAMMATMAAMVPESNDREQGKNVGVKEEEKGEEKPVVMSEEHRGQVEEAVTEDHGHSAVESTVSPIVPTEPAVESAPVVIPPMEELEQNDNALLFDEVILEDVVVEKPVKEPKKEKGRKKEEKVVRVEVQEEKMEAKSVEETKPETPVAPHTTSATTQASLLDYLQSPQRTLGESLAAGRPQPVGNMEKKVDDLRSVININDKFSFMSELFHNNMKAYNDFIMSLNAISQRDEALAYVRDAAAQQKWDESSPTVQAFYRVFDKKF